MWPETNRQVLLTGTNAKVSEDTDVQYLASLMSSSMQSQYSVAPVKITPTDEGIFAFVANERKVDVHKKTSELPSKNIELCLLTNKLVTGFNRREFPRLVYYPQYKKSVAFAYIQIFLVARDWLLQGHLVATEAYVWFLFWSDNIYIQNFFVGKRREEDKHPKQRLLQLLKSSKWKPTGKALLQLWTTHTNNAYIINPNLVLRWTTIIGPG